MLPDELYCEAVDKDIEQKIEEAAALYVALLATNAAPLEAYINLAVLYWQCIDYGFLSFHHLSDAFLESAYYEPVLDEAEKRFGFQPEIAFWRLYCERMYGGIGPFVEQCLDLVKAPGCTLVPYFYLFVMAKGQEYHAEVRCLLGECKQCPTTKNRYIISMIGSTIKSYKIKL